MATAPTKTDTFSANGIISSGTVDVKLNGTSVWNTTKVNLSGAFV